MRLFHGKDRATAFGVSAFGSWGSPPLAFRSTSERRGGLPGAAAFGAGVGAGSALWWVILTFVVGRLRGRVTPRALRWVNVASGLLILAPLALRRSGPDRGIPQFPQAGTRHSRPSRAKLRLAVLVYFLALGIAYLFLELPLMQRMILLLDQPTYSFSAVLFVLLLAILNKPPLFILLVVIYAGFFGAPPKFSAAIERDYLTPWPADIAERRYLERFAKLAGG